MAEFPAPCSGELKKWFSSDNQFQHLYPVSIQQLAQKHWTPLRVARRASGFLVTEDNLKILDIGSGAGKFCLAAAFYKPGAFYYGIEQRKNLVAHAEVARKILKTPNVTFMHGNFTGLDFRLYDHFYFYNSFYENLAYTEKIDETVACSLELYNSYTRCLYQQLEQTVAGTKLVTYNSLGHELPPCFQLVASETDSLLKFWLKQ